MSKLEIGRIDIVTNNLGEMSSVPSVLKQRNSQQVKKSNLDENDELFIGYGFIDNIFPYANRDLYDANFSKKAFKTIVLENEYLKAIFLPELGGRLWSLYDKEKGRDLLLNGDEFAYANLAICDAWFCGGVEWNMGIVGHSPFTCENVYTALTKTDDGTPVVRFYEYERIHRCTYQVDCWLPDGANRLYVGVRIVNSSDEVVPMYWWSNIAVEEEEKTRVIAPANEAYTQRKSVVEKIRAFKSEAGDITYPVQNPMSIDYFWRTKDAERKFVSSLDKEGYGLCQTSSSRLQGRKLFVWGQGEGAERWQKLLRVKCNSGHYIEIQAGLAQTQYECLPMPPNTAWEWVESYGPIQVDPQTVHGDYENAWKSMEKIVARENLEDVLKNASHMRKKAEEIILCGSEWGAVEEKKREVLKHKPLNKNLTFCCKEDNEWLGLLLHGTLGKHNAAEAPKYWMLDREYTKMLQDALSGKDRDNWYSWMHYGMIKLAGGDFDTALACFEKSISLEENVWAHYGRMCLYWNMEDKETSAEIAKEVLSIANENISVIRSALDVLIKVGQYDFVLKYTGNLSQRCCLDGRVLLHRLTAMIRCFMLDEAEELMNTYKDEICTNIREGELSVTDLRRDLLRLKAEKSGKPTENIEPEAEWNFIMYE